MSPTVLVLIIFCLASMYRGYEIWKSSKPKTYTVCPKCGKRKASVPKGSYRCKSCGAVFKVDHHGEADISTVTSIWLTIVAGLLFALIIPVLSILNLSKFDLMRSILYGLFGTLAFIVGVRDLCRHKARFRA